MICMFRRAKPSKASDARRDINWKWEYRIGSNKRFVLLISNLSSFENFQSLEHFDVIPFSFRPITIYIRIACLLPVAHPLNRLFASKHFLSNTSCCRLINSQQELFLYVSLGSKQLSLLGCANPIANTLVPESSSRGFTCTICRPCSLCEVKKK